MALIAASLAVIQGGLVALFEGDDADLAMRRPFATTIVLTFLFARIARAIALQGMKLVG